ncbi:MAG: GspH/FimT family pseudopilin [Lautropia sp.]|nr:GspH/FimT family pseudopilin [Lautropia sp.]
MGKGARQTARRAGAGVEAWPGSGGHRRKAGFTLIELLVAMVIAAVIISMVAISGTQSPARALQMDADRLAQLLALAREEAQVRGSPIRFETDGNNYQFAVFRDSQWRLVDDDTYLRPRRWDLRTEVQVRRADGARFLEFGRDLVEAPYVVRLLRGDMVAEISANGLGSFEVLQP